MKVAGLLIAFILGVVASTVVGLMRMSDDARWSSTIHSATNNSLESYKAMNDTLFETNQTCIKDLNACMDEQDELVEKPDFGNCTDAVLWLAERDERRCDHQVILQTHPDAAQYPPGAWDDMPREINCPPPPGDGPFITKNQHCFDTAPQECPSIPNIMRAFWDSDCVDYAPGSIEQQMCDTLIYLCNEEAGSETGISPNSYCHTVINK